jgi:hypothetical protein
VTSEGLPSKPHSGPTRKEDAWGPHLLPLRSDPTLSCGLAPTIQQSRDYKAWSRVRVTRRPWVPTSTPPPKIPSHLCFQRQSTAHAAQIPWPFLSSSHTPCLHPPTPTAFPSPVPPTTLCFHDGCQVRVGGWWSLEGGLPWAVQGACPRWAQERLKATWLGVCFSRVTTPCMPFVQVLPRWGRHGWRRLPHGALLLPAAEPW